MHPLLERILKARGLESIDKLTAEEKSWIEEKQKRLTAGPVTLETLAVDCENMLGAFEAQMRELGNTDQKNRSLVFAFSFVSLLLSRIRGGDVERENLEKYLTALIQT